MDVEGRLWRTQKARVSGVGGPLPIQTRSMILCASFLLSSRPSSSQVSFLLLSSSRFFSVRICVSFFFFSPSVFVFSSSLVACPLSFSCPFCSSFLVFDCQLFYSSPFYMFLSSSPFFLCMFPLFLLSVRFSSPVARSAMCIVGRKRQIAYSVMIWGLLQTCRRL